MHRRPLLQLLDHYAKRYPDEDQVVEKIRQLVTTSSHCFERTCRPGHITGSAWVLSHDRCQCLLVHHGKLNRWLQPGGHCDGETDVASVALREVQEETGLMHLELVQENGLLMPLDADVHLIPARQNAEGHVTENAHEHHDIRFLMVAAFGQNLVQSSESNDVRWFDHDEVLQATNEESVLRMLRKAGPFA